MAPGTHLLISWLSSVELLKQRRERVIVALSGVAPDIDGFGAVVDKLTGTTDFYFRYHHYLGHSILSAIVFSTVAAFFASSQRTIVWILSFVLVHVHIICDVVGSKGPDGYHWPVYYLYPFNPNYELTWEHQWELNAWPNFVIMAGLILVSLYYASTRKITFLEVFSRRLDREAFIMYDKYVRKTP